MDFNKPRVSVWYYVLPGGRNDGGGLFLSYNLRKLLDGKDALVHNTAMQGTSNVVHVQPNMPLSGLGKFDLNILVDHGEDGLPVPLDFELPHPNAYWIADSHLGYEYRLNRARQFDFVFVSHKPSIPKFIRDGIDPARIHYLPWAAESSCYQPVGIVEKYDWCFIGHMNNHFRINLIDRFSKEWPLGSCGYLGWRMAEFPGHNVFEDAARKFCQSRIVLNESILDDVNMRCFEALACRRFLLTEDVPGVRDHFEDGKHLVLFKTIDEAVEKARWYLQDPVSRETIAEAGYKEFLARHTYMHRTREILKICVGWEDKVEVPL